jgi:hypothetical protein
MQQVHLLANRSGTGRLHGLHDQAGGDAPRRTSIAGVTGEANDSGATAARRGWAGSREVASYGALPLFSFRTVLEGLRDAGRDVPGARAAGERWLGRLDPADPAHRRVATSMAQALEGYAVHQVTGGLATPVRSDLRRVTVEMTRVLNGDDEPITAARRMLALAFEFAAVIRSGNGDESRGDRTIGGLVEALGDALREVVNEEYPEARRLYESVAAVPDAGVTTLHWS